MTWHLKMWTNFYEDTKPVYNCNIKSPNTKIRAENDVDQWLINDWCRSACQNIISLHFAPEVWYDTLNYHNCNTINQDRHKGKWMCLHRLTNIPNKVIWYVTISWKFVLVIWIRAVSLPWIMKRRWVNRAHHVVRSWIQTFGRRITATVCLWISMHSRHNIWQIWTSHVVWRNSIVYWGVWQGRRWTIRTTTCGTKALWLGWSTPRSIVLFILPGWLWRAKLAWIRIGHWECILRRTVSWCPIWVTSENNLPLRREHRRRAGATSCHGCKRWRVRSFWWVVIVLLLIPKNRISMK